MKNRLEYKGYLGEFSYEEGDEEMHGTVLNLREVIHFRGASLAELRQSLQASVEDYLARCAEEGRSPEKPYTGRFVVRLDPDLHRRISARAQASGMSLNQWVNQALERETA